MKISKDKYLVRFSLYTANGHNFTFLIPPALHRWEREFMESSNYARSQYIIAEIIGTGNYLIHLYLNFRAAEQET